MRSRPARSTTVTSRSKAANLCVQLNSSVKSIRTAASGCVRSVSVVTGELPRCSSCGARQRPPAWEVCIGPVDDNVGWKDRNSPEANRKRCNVLALGAHHGILCEPVAGGDDYRFDAVRAIAVVFSDEPPDPVKVIDREWRELKRRTHPCGLSRSARRLRSRAIASSPSTSSPRSA